MVWYRAWLETWSRVVFTVLWLAFFVGVLVLAGRGPGPEGVALGRTLTVLSFTWIFVPVWLAGSGVRTQAGFGRGAMRGLHGSTHFTLSLPVSRARLLLVRGAVGLIESACVIALLGAAVWVLLPAVSSNASFADLLRHLLGVFTIGVAFFGLSSLTATLLDDVWHVWSSTLVIMVLWAPPLRRWLPDAMDVFRPMVETSPLVTHVVPWAAMSVAVVAGGLFMLAAIRVVNRQEY
jgi:hypothetical protein